MKNNISYSSKTLLNFMEEYFSDHHASLDLKSDFFKTHLQKGCLLMLDGLDEVNPEDRLAVRSAVEELLEEFNNPNLRCLLASRPSAIHITDQMKGFGSCEVQRLTPEKRDHLIKLWYQAVLADSLPEARRKANDLASRIKDSNRSVQDLATTPLMVTIVAMVHYSRDELPKQRAKLYEDAVEVLLTEVPFKGEEAKELQRWGGMDWDVRRDRIARIAFELRERGKDWLLENDLVNLIWQRFGNDETEARRSASRFLRDMAERGGLLEAVDEKYGFYTHATFQEYLAGRYLAEEYPQEQLPTFLREHIRNDLWDEALRLAVGYLAIKGEESANRFVIQIANSGTTEETQPRALFVAGLALADLPQDRRLPETVNYLVAQIKDLFTANPPRTGIRARFNLGIALGSLGDPRLKPNETDCVMIPAGVFRMGISEEDEELLEAQKVNVWEDEKPTHTTYVSEFFMGKYPVTNVEYAAFYEAKGYENQDYWSQAGWNWRTGKWDSNFSWLSEDLQKPYKEWLARRPGELRGKPFFWEDPQWNAPNLPVVGVSWFEAEAYCNWLSRITEKSYRLPTEAEWEKAARFFPLPKGERKSVALSLLEGDGESLLWSWGNTWRGGLCNTSNTNITNKLNRTSPVGMYPNGTSPCGVFDMIGNVWEWCCDWYFEDIYKQPIEAESKGLQGSVLGAARVVRGGSWGSSRDFARCTYRNAYGPDNFDSRIGFRVVLLSEVST